MKAVSVSDSALTQQQSSRPRSYISTAIDLWEVLELFGPCGIILFCYICLILGKFDVLTWLQIQIQSQVFNIEV